MGACPKVNAVDKYTSRCSHIGTWPMMMETPISRGHWGIEDNDVHVRLNVRVHEHPEKPHDHLNTGILAGISAITTPLLDVDNSDWEPVEATVGETHVSDAHCTDWASLFGESCRYSGTSL